MELIFNISHPFENRKLMVTDRQLVNRRSFNSADDHRIVDLLFGYDNYLGQAVLIGHPSLSFCFDYIFPFSVLS
jgi:hypothetical protein